MRTPAPSAADPRARHLLPHSPLEWSALAVACAAVLVQAYAYFHVLPLSLGPRVIMQPWLMNQPGHMIYEQIADQHSPLMPLAISWFAPFSPEGWRLATVFLVVLLSLSTVLTWWAGRRSAGALGGLFAAVFFVCWAGPFGFDKLWHESFLTPLYLAVLILFRPAGPGRSLLSLASAGLVCGMALLTKQQAAAVLLAFVGWNLATGWRARRPTRELLVGAGVIGLSALLPLGVYGVYHYWRAGTLANLWFWAVEYSVASRYASLAWSPPTLADVLQVSPAFVLVPVVLLGIRHRRRQGDPAWETDGWGLLLAAASCLGAYPRYGAFHLQPLLPVLAWLSATALVRMRGAGGQPAHDAPSGRGVFVVSVVVVGLLSLVPFVKTYRACPRSSMAPRHLRVLGSEAARDRGEEGDWQRRQLSTSFPTTRRRRTCTTCSRTPPPRFWVFSYPWYMTAPIRQRILRTLDSEQPRWIVHPVGRWETDRFAPDVLAYIKDHYDARARLRWAQGAVEVLERAGPPASDLPAADDRPRR